MWGQTFFGKLSLYDVVIIGAGPAGSTLARLLGEHQSILLVDSRGFGQQAKEKCCGGLLAPDAQAWLARQNLALPASVLEQAQPLTVRAMDLNSRLVRRYPRNYFNLNRLKFERWLHSLLPSGVACKFATRMTGFKLHANKTELKLKCNNTVSTVSTRMLVAADGANSVVRSLLSYPARVGSTYFALQESYTSSTLPGYAQNEYAAIFDPQVTDFYAWIIPKHHEVLLGAALPAGLSKKDICRRWLHLKRELANLGYEFAMADKRQGAFVLRPGCKDIFLGKPGVYMIGEAAGWISPSSAEGFSYAFASAYYLAQAILANPGSLAQILASYTRLSNVLKYNIAWKQAKSMIMYNYPLRKLVMQSGLLSI